MYSIINTEPLDVDPQASGGDGDNCTSLFSDMEDFIAKLDLQPYFSKDVDFDSKIESFFATGCECKLFKVKPCYILFSKEHYECAALTRNKLDWLNMAHICHEPEMSQGPPNHTVPTYDECQRSPSGITSVRCL